MAAKLSALRASHTLPPGFFIFLKDSWYSFMILLIIYFDFMAAFPCPQ
jgi:hypothetical protein